MMREIYGLAERVDLGPLHEGTVVITGASGLIGTWLMDTLFYLFTQGRKVLRAYAVVHQPPSDYLRTQAEFCGFQVIRADLSEPQDYGFLPRADLVIHAAGPAQPAQFMAEPLATMGVNVGGTLALLRRLNPGGRFLFCSSNAVYTGREGPTTEQDIGTSTPSDSRAAYIEGKRGGEALCQAVRRQGVKALVVRLGDVYGPGTRRGDQRAINAFIRQALCEGHIDLLDAGLAVKTYLYAADATLALWRLLLYGTQDTYNVCGREVVTVGAVAQTIGRLAGAAVNYPDEARPVVGAPAQAWRDTTRYDTEFGPTEYVGLEDGLRRTIEWQRQLYR